MNKEERFDKITAMVLEIYINSTIEDENGDPWWDKYILGLMDNAREDLIAARDSETITEQEAESAIKRGEEFLHVLREHMGNYEEGEDVR